MQDADVKSQGVIPQGSICFLKGAARVTTAIAAVVACSKLKVEARGWKIVGII
jgi:hypothetical protein